MVSLYNKKMEDTFLEWFRENEKRFAHAQFDDKQIAYAAWQKGSESNIETLNRKSREIHNKMIAKGHWDNEREIGTLLMLIVTELSEAFEAYREDRYANISKGVDAFKSHIKDTFEDEIADVFIRLFDLCGFLNIDIEKYIKLKLKYNEEREYRHGKSC